MNTTLIVVLAAIINITALVVFVHILEKRKRKKKLEISFKETLDLVEVPLVTFKFKARNGAMKKLNFIIDTGASDCFIDDNIVNELSPDKIDWTELLDNTVCTPNGQTESSRSCYIEFYYDNSTFISSFVTMDLSSVIEYTKSEYGVSIAGQIGSSFFKAANANINFETLKLVIDKKLKETIKCKMVC